MTSSDEKKNKPESLLVTNPVVAELYAAWRAREQKLDEHKKQVRAAVQAFADGTGPDPTRLIADLADLREDCNSVCSSLVWAVRRAKGQTEV